MYFGIEKYPIYMNKKTNMYVNSILEKFFIYNEIIFFKYFEYML